MGTTTDIPEITSSFTEYAIFIVLLPMLAFPVILFLLQEGWEIQSPEESQQTLG